MIVGDLKTPAEARKFLSALDWMHHSYQYLDPDDQIRWLESFPELDKILQWNSIQRRNLGYLVALEAGARSIVTIDDDNFPLADDFVSEHVEGLGDWVEGTVAESELGWINVCEALVFDGGFTPYHRGFPVVARFQQANISLSKRQIRPVVNAGLWLGEPDVDAATRVTAPASAVASASDWPSRFALAPGTWSPFNSQNTAFSSSILVTMYLVVMRRKYRGQSVDRYDDIWASYFARLIIDSMGDAVQYGTPLVRQVRNEHNHAVDLIGEAPGMLLTDGLVEALRSFVIRESTYDAGYRSLSDQLRTHYSRDGIDEDERIFWNDIAHEMIVWADVVSSVGGVR
ncbi:hypothetical protein [Nocardioides sp. SYSU D00038]|uniref:hypothetical protein n=1 Tax=Nocardioides sp. SYSU D00038 TaxID=2812554 RepID=UPI0019688870|nr:hypothetical protein [Nocardioides sp. SYSU D00038]